MVVKSGLCSVTLIENAAASRIYGFDGDFTIHVTDGFSLSGGVGLQNGRFTDYKNAQFITADGIRSSIDATGNVTPMTPSFSGNLSANYTTPLFGGRAFASATLSHTSSYYVSGGNRLKMPAYSLLNGSIGWRADRSEERRLGKECVST